MIAYKFLTKNHADKLGYKQKDSKPKKTKMNEKWPSSDEF